MAKKQKPRAEDAPRPKVTSVNGSAPPATLPKPSVSAEFMLQARRPKVPAVGEDGDEAAGSDGVKGKRDATLGGTYLHNLRFIFRVELIYSPL